MKFYNIACLVSGAAHLILSSALFINPEGVIGSFGVPTPEVVAFVARRAAALFFGLSALSFVLAAVRTKHWALVLILCVPWFALVGTGAYEYLRGYVGIEILPAMVTEAILGTILLLAGFQALRSGRGRPS